MDAHDTRQPGNAPGILCSITGALLLICLMLSGSAAFSFQPLAFSLATPYRAPPALALSDDEREWLSRHPVLNVAVNTSGYEPIDIVDDRNRFQGISADYLALVSAQLELPVRVLAFANAAEAVSALRDGKVDVLVGANDFERSQGLTLFSQNYLEDRTIVLGRQDDSGLLPDLAGLRMAVQDGYLDVAQLERFYPGSDLVVSPTLFSGLDAVSQGGVDVLIGNELVLRRQLLLRPYLGVVARFESPLPSSGFAFAFNEARGDRLRELFDKALVNLGPSIAREIRERWTKDHDRPNVRGGLKLTRGERTWLRRHPVVTVAELSRPPYLYRNAKGEWAGLTVDVLNRVSRVTGLSFQYLEKDDAAALLGALGDGAADMSASFSATPDRQDSLNFTYAFGGNHWMFVLPAHRASPSSLDQLDGMTLALPAGHALEEVILRRYPNIVLRSVPDPSQAIRLVESGAADLTVQSEVAASRLSSGSLKAGAVVEGVWAPQRFVVVKRHPELLSILNKALEDFPATELKALHARWLGDGVSSRPWWQGRGSWWFGATVFLACLTASWFYGHRRLLAQAEYSAGLESRLKAQRLHQKAMLDGIPQPIFMLDGRGRVLACNRPFEQVTGVGFEQISGRRLVDVELLPEALARQLHATSLIVLRDHQPVNEHGEDGVSYWFAPFPDPQGDVQGVLGGWQVDGDTFRNHGDM